MDDLDYHYGDVVPLPYSHTVVVHAVRYNAGTGQIEFDYTFTGSLAGFKLTFYQAHADAPGLSTGRFVTFFDGTPTTGTQTFAMGPPYLYIGDTDAANYRIQVFIGAFTPGPFGDINIDVMYRLLNIGPHPVVVTPAVASARPSRVGGDARFKDVSGAGTIDSRRYA